MFRTKNNILKFQKQKVKERVDIPYPAGIYLLEVSNGNNNSGLKSARS